MAKWTLRRVYLNSAGYDDTGTYYGKDLPLYRAECETPVDYPSTGANMLRAATRDKAKRYVREHYDNAATFYS